MVLLVMRLMVFRAHRADLDQKETRDVTVFPVHQVSTVEMVIRVMKEPAMFAALAVEVTKVTED